jgi:hypothetical protein
MSRGGTLLFLSPRSWIVDGERCLRRPDCCDTALGLGRGGSDCITPVVTQETPATSREMYEVFTTGSYGIVDGSAQITTLDGFTAVSDLFRRVTFAEDVYVEEYHGGVCVPKWSHAWLRSAPHASYFPSRLLSAVMDKMLIGTSEEVSIARPLFAQTWWILRCLINDRKKPLGMNVDNRTFPTEITVSPRLDPRCKVTAMTRFREPAPLMLLAEESPWHLVCDGLIIL